MNRSIPQFEIAVAREAFNLAAEQGVDPDRVLREKAEFERRLAEAEAYTARMQKSFEACPGFLGADAPRGPGLPGVVVVEAGQATEAMLWLKKRFRVSEKAEIDVGRGLCLEIISKTRKAVNGSQPRRASFHKPTQFELNLI